MTRSPLTHPAAMLLALVLATAAPAVALENDVCANCHADKSMLEQAGARAEALVVTDESLVGSPHEGFSCSDCHQDLAPGDAEIPHPPKLAPAGCSPCHDDTITTFSESDSVHARKFQPAPGARTACAACHGSHAIRPSDDPDSRTHRLKLAETCAGCHKPGPGGAGPVSEWKRSVHGRAALEWEVEDAPTCSVCHKPHEVRQPEDPRDPLNRRNQMNVCGACHPSELKTVLRGVHGKAWQKGNLASAICTDCHGAHDIQRPRDRDSRTYASSVSRTCGKCHGDPDLTTRFHLRPDSVITYDQSFHGQATQWGSTAVANCASCHRYHDIRAASDPASSVNPKNLKETCGRADCHPAASPAFLNLPVHAKAARVGVDWPRITRVSYLLILSATIVFMIVHQVLEAAVLRRSKKAAHGQGPPEEPVRRPRIAPLSRFELRDGGWTVSRWDTNQIVQHLLLVISFTTLVLTGFALQMPANWARSLGEWGPTLFDLRSLLHRMAALIMIGLSIYHAAWLIRTARGRRELIEMLPDPLHDLKDLKGSFAWFVGARPDMPPARRYTYREKMEYWALVWGTLVMVVSGVILWT
ncbi:MAG: cytochrome c3 family protein, partial [Acidobacteria bacterium]|nr:cytochrome c3 family protein [Acidobacteriota bacterium]